MISRVFLSPETELFFVKTLIIHALVETTSEAYTVLVLVFWWYKFWPKLINWNATADDR